ncbi:unnamed protein product [Menidia menidia]|uniref:(Atlantic silverside) hypothetical protein n=1 Tax=Menidia menidia TaxID=238744 RepID=A0A8S4BME3_9TELE|nr:unnamed protein product [Menidia menidia]
MSSGGVHQAAREAGLRNCVRFVWKETAVGGRDWFVKTVLIDGLKVDPGQVFCLQWNPSDNCYDVTLHSQVMYDRLLMTCKAKAESVPSSLFKVEPLGQRNVRVITVHMYNPYVGDSSESSLERILRVGMAFDTLLPIFHSEGKGVFCFARVNRVFVGSVALSAGCTVSSGNRCRNCGGEGHGAASCSQQKTCNGCGKTGHLFRVCPSRGCTYAAVAGESLGPSLGPLVEELQEVQGVEGDLPAGKAATAAEADPGAEPFRLMGPRTRWNNYRAIWNSRQSLVGQGRRRKWMWAGQHAETQPNGAPLSLSGRYDIFTGDSGEGVSSGPVAVKAGPVEGSNMVTLEDGSGVESRPVELGLASPLSPTHSFLEAGSPSSVAYLQELGSYGPDGSLGVEAEGTVGETERG